MAKTLSQIVGKARTHLLYQDEHLQRALGTSTEGVVDTALSVATASPNAGAIAKHGAAALSGESSLSEFTQSSNVEPRVMLEETLRNLPNLDKFFLTLTNLYSAYYLMATALSAEVGGVTVISQLDRFNPNRNPLAALNDVVRSRYAKESYLESGYVLPTKNNNTKLVVKPSVLAVQLATEADNSDKEKPTSMQISSGLKQIQDVDSLAVGRLLEVTLTISGREFKVPVAVRVRPMSVPTLIMRELVALGDIRESWKERWHRMRAGELALVSDWIFQSDRIRNKRKLMALDKQGLYKEMLERRKNNKAAAAISGNTSIGSAASFIIISKETAKAVEYRSGMPIENAEFRNRVFAENSAMMIIVVDREWERIQCYTRGVSGVAEYSFKQFENMSKGNGPDIMDIMKQYTIGSNARF